MSKKYILTDGKNYVIENPMKEGEYMQSTCYAKAKQFEYKQARALVQRGRKKYSWIRNYQLLDIDTGEECEHSLNYRGNANIYINGTDFNVEILDEIFNETNSLLGLAGWSMDQLNTYKNLLLTGLSEYDSAVSDIEHALQVYRKETNGKKAAAHKMAKIGYLLDEVRGTREKIKQCQAFIDVMIQAINNHYTIEKIKFEISNAKHREYKGRTKYYQTAMDILRGNCHD